MRRWSLIIVTAVSVGVSVVTVGLWIESYWVSDGLLWRSGEYGSISLNTYRGTVDIMRAESAPDNFWFTSDRDAEGRCPRWARGNPKWRALGFAYYSDPDIHNPPLLSGILGTPSPPGPPPIPFVEFVVPIWPFVLMFAMFPLLRGWQWFSRRRVASGLCVQCGYDLRAHKPGQKCPECGTVVAARCEGPSDED